MEFNFKIGGVYHAALTFKERNGGDERVFSHQGWRVIGITLDETLTKKRVKFEVARNHIVSEPDFPVGKRIAAVAYQDAFNGETSEVCVRVATANRHGFCVYANEPYAKWAKDDEEAADNGKEG